MNIALMLHHGIRPTAANETMSHPHVELLASTAAEARTLKTIADQLAAFASVPFSFHEVESIGATQHGAILRVALCERPTTTTPTKAG